MTRGGGGGTNKNELSKKRTVRMEPNKWIEGVQIRMKQSENCTVPWDPNK